MAARHHEGPFQRQAVRVQHHAAQAAFHRPDCQVLGQYLAGYKRDGRDGRCGHVAAGGVQVQAQPPVAGHRGEGELAGFPVYAAGDVVAEHIHAVQLGHRAGDRVAGVAIYQAAHHPGILGLQRHDHVQPALTLWQRHRADAAGHVIGVGRDAHADVVFSAAARFEQEAPAPHRRIGEEERVGWRW